MNNNSVFCDSGIVEDKSLEYSEKYQGYTSDRFPFDKSDSSDSPDIRDYSPDSTDKSQSFVCFARHKWDPDLLHTRIPIAAWRLAELEFFSTKIPIAKWRLREFYMEKKNKMLRGTATSFGFKRPVSASAAVNTKPNVTASQNVAPLAQQELTNSVESLVIAPTARSGTPRLTRPKKDTNGANVKTNRFGFRSSNALSNKVADSQNNVNSTKANLRLEGLVTQASGEEAKLPPRSHLPRLQQFPVRLAAPAHYRPRNASADKSAKTAANNHTARRSRSENGGSSASSVNDADSGVGSQKSGGELEMIEQLECSPSVRNRMRNAQKSRPMEMIFPSGAEKKFELRDLRDSIEVTEIMPLELPPLPLAKRLSREQGLVRERAKAYTRQLSRENNSASSEDDEGIEDEPGEEKVHRDRVLSEKDERGVVGAGEEGAEGEDLWGHGEAMVGEEDMPRDDMHSDNDSDDSPGSPGTPTHTSNSLSLSSDIRDRDFIDDEICDQPGLVYDNVTANSSGNTIIADETSPKFAKPLSAVGHLTVDCGPGSARHSSVGTLSPCESIASDDLIMDFDLSAVDDDHRLDTSSLDAALTDGELDGEEQAEQVIHELNTLLASRPELMNGVRATRQLRQSRVGSGANSPRSLDTPRLRSGSALSSPLRSSRQGTSSPGEDLSEDSGIRVQRGTYQSMYQDVINIKALLLRLSRHVQESEADHPLETQKNGFYPSSDPTSERKGEASQQEMIADLQRQVVFLQSQVEEKERRIRCLEAVQPPEPRQTDILTCNAATQTDRIRPLSTGPILSTQPDAAGGSFVSNTSDSTTRVPLTIARPVSRLPQWRRAPSPSPSLSLPPATVTDLHKSPRKLM